MKLDKVIKEYIETRKFSKLAVETKRQYLGALDTLEKELGNIDIDKVRRRDLMKVLNGLYDRPGMAMRFIRVCSVFFNFAHDMEYCNGSPAQRLERPKLGSWDRWEDEDVMKAIDMNDSVVSTAVALAYYTGQRESDILSMKWSDIKDGSIYVTQNKTGATLVIKMAPVLIRILDKLERVGDYIVTTDGTMMTGARFRVTFKRRTRQLGIERTFHGLRKTVGSKLAENGSSTNEIAAILGHKTLSMAALYTKQASSTKLIASAVDNLS